MLRISREHEFAVPPLELPDPKRLPALAVLYRYESVALFVQRAQIVKPYFALTNENAPAVAEICRQLDGLPLAIELAAARSKLLSPQDILERLHSKLGLLTAGMRDLLGNRDALGKIIAPRGVAAGQGADILCTGRRSRSAWWPTSTASATRPVTRAATG